MKAKHALIVLIIGYCVDIIGGLFKIEHREYADNMLLIAAVLKVVAAIIFLIKLLTYPKLKDFLEW